jgi:site-specific DNA-methyltransferase (adenine-specific)
MIIHGDCLEVMSGISDHSIDMILCDLPYGTTDCHWDTVIPFEPLWAHYKRIIKDNGAIVLTASQPFATDLINSNREWFKYEWVWNKNNSCGFLLAKFRPFIITEYVLIFGCGNIKYNPCMEKRGYPRSKGGYSKSENYGCEPSKSKSKSNEYYPKNIINISNCCQTDKQHPTQKPVALFEYLIKTYTNEGDLVLDNCSGSGTTGVACLNLNRKFILIEKEEKYIDIINKRLADAQAIIDHKARQGSLWR